MAAPAVGRGAGDRREGGEAPLAALLREVLGNDLPFAIRTWEGQRVGPPDAPATVVVRSPDALARLVQRPGQLGLARAYVAGDLDVEGDILHALTSGDALARVRPTLGQWYRAARLAGPHALRRLAPPQEEAHLHGRRHSPERDLAAVSHHYDVSDDFYRVLLGPSMTYSCAVWDEATATLEGAQAAKHELICAKLDLSDGQRLLDVGCGWGGMLEHAARRNDVEAVGVTLSTNQQRWAAERLAPFGSRVAARLQDYRAVDDGPYDAVCSIGMSEHVGQANLAEYFGRLFSLLRPGGRIVNHAISSLPSGRVPERWPVPVRLPRAALGARFARDSFIDRYVFPDGELVEVGVVVSTMQQVGFEVRHVESLREHYGLTLRRWLANLEAGWDAAVAAAGERRTRAWRLYVAGSAASFERGRIGVHQVLAVKPAAGHSGMPLRPRFG